VVITVERDGDGPSAGSLGALAVARGLADSVGATVYALCPVLEEDDLDRWAGALGAAGADRIAAARWPGARQPATWATHGPVIAALADALQPRLILVPASAGGRDIAPRLATRLEAPFVPDAALERGPDGAVALSRSLPGAARRVRHTLTDATGCCVATIAAPPPIVALGDDDIDVAFFDVETPVSRLVRLESSPDPDAALERARVVVTAGRGVATAERMALVESVARAVGGEVAGTRGACLLGLVPPSRVVGVDGRRVDPELYLAIGASGSHAHLGGVGPDAEIVAIGADPDAPIFAVASYGLVGDLDEILPALLASLEPPGEGEAGVAS
jgi:electron transfer flavoprotein alpha subunit